MSRPVDALEISDISYQSGKRYMLSGMYVHIRCCSQTLTQGRWQAIHRKRCLGNYDYLNRHYHGIPNQDIVGFLFCSLELAPILNVELVTHTAPWVPIPNCCSNDFIARYGRQYFAFLRKAQ